MGNWIQYRKETVALADVRQMLRTDEVATLLGIAVRTVCLWAECGELPAVKVGRQWRFRRDDIEQCLQLGLKTSAQQRETAG